MAGQCGRDQANAAARIQQQLVVALQDQDGLLILTSPNLLLPTQVDGSLRFQGCTVGITAQPGSAILELDGQHGVRSRRRGDVTSAEECDNHHDEDQGKNASHCGGFQSFLTRVLFAAYIARHLGNSRSRFLKRILLRLRTIGKLAIRHQPCL